MGGSLCSGQKPSDEGWHLKTVHYVILGNGVSGIEAASLIRREEPSARISIVSAESDHFFSRPALMYVFAGQLRLEDTEPHDRGFYARMGFERLRARP